MAFSADVHQGEVLGIMKKAVGPSACSLVATTFSRGRRVLFSDMKYWLLNGQAE